MSESILIVGILLFVLLAALAMGGYYSVVLFSRIFKDIFSRKKI